MLRDLQGYYRALTVHPHHNYYFGRSEADLTPWLEYFIATLAEVFEAVRIRAQKCAENGRAGDARSPAPPGSQSESGTGPLCRKRDHHSPQVAARAGPFREDGQEPSQGLGGRRMAGDGKSVTPRQKPIVYRQNIGNTSAAYRQCPGEEKNER